MAAVTICSDFGALKDKLCHCFHCFPIYLWWSSGTRCHDHLLFECWVLNVKSAFSLSSFTFIKRLFCSFLLFAIRVVSSAYLKWKKREKSVSHVHLFATPWTVAYQAPLSMEFSKQGYWSGWPFPSPEDLPNPAIEAESPILQADVLLPEPPGTLRLLTFLLAILIPACASSSSAFCMLYSVSKLNKQGDSVQPWLTPFLIWNQSVVHVPF